VNDWNDLRKYERFVTRPTLDRLGKPVNGLAKIKEVPAMRISYSDQGSFNSQQIPWSPGRLTQLGL
jgi:hypothetical protein